MAEMHTPASGTLDRSIHAIVRRVIPRVRIVQSVGGGGGVHSRQRRGERAERWCRAGKRRVRIVRGAGTQTGCCGIPALPSRRLRCAVIGSDSRRDGALASLVAVCAFDGGAEGCCVVTG